MTHAEAAECYPSLIGNEDGAPVAGGEVDGVIMPALNDDGVQPGILRWLGDVTLYYRPRAASGVTGNTRSA